MSFQSPPFWCLMTTLQEFAKVRETPPRCVHDLYVFLWNAYRILRGWQGLAGCSPVEPAVLPLWFYTQQYYRQVLAGTTGDIPGTSYCITASLAPLHRYWPGSTIGTTNVHMYWPVLPVRRRYYRWSRETSPTHEILQGTHRWIEWVQDWFVQVRKMIPPYLSKVNPLYTHKNRKALPRLNGKLPRPFFGRLWVVGKSIFDET